MLGLTARPKQDQQGLADLAGRKTERKASKDHPIDLRRAARVGADDRDRAVAAGPRDVELDIAKLGQKMPSIVAIAAIGAILGLELIEIAVDRRRHLLSVINAKKKAAPSQARNLLGHVKRFFGWAIDQRVYRDVAAAFSRLVISALQ